MFHRRLFCRSFLHADDIVLIVPSALAQHYALCSPFAIKMPMIINCISFNASKSKYLVVLPRKCRFLSEYKKDFAFYGGNNPIKYVDSFEHLSHVIANQLTDNADIFKRGSDFVAESNNVLCFFSKLTSLIKYRLIVYARLWQ